MSRRRNCTRVSRQLAIGMALLSAMVECASSAERDPENDRRHAAAVVRALLAHGDADSVAAAAILEPGRPKSLELARRASALAPERPELVWLEASKCNQSPECDSMVPEARLRALDPANGAGYFGSLQRAARAHNDNEVQEALRGVAKTDRVDIYWLGLIHDLTLAVDRTRQQPLATSLVDVIGALAAEAIPAYQSFSNGCKGDALARPERVDACRGVARALMNGDTFITQFIGLRIAERLWPATEEEGRRARALERTLRYRMEVWGSLVTDANTSDKASAAYLELCAVLRTEPELAAAQLRQAGTPTTPPDGWTPRIGSN